MLLTVNPDFVKLASDSGTWWTTVRPMEMQWLRSRLQNMGPMTKAAAGIGGDQEEGFEQAFSSLALAYLKEKAPRLMDFIVGFQLIDRNDDNTKAIGVFGFKVGDAWYYAPVFFLNGDLKGHELLYIKKQDMFVPLKENWVNHLISRQPRMLGEGSARNTYQLGGMYPNLNRFSSPPVGTKYGSAETRWDDYYNLAMADTREKRASLIESVKSSHCGIDLKQFMSHNFPLLKFAYEHLYCKFPLIKQGFDTFYGKNFWKEAAEAAKAVEETTAKSKEAPIPMMDSVEASTARLFKPVKKLTLQAPEQHFELLKTARAKADNDKAINEDTTERSTGPLIKDLRDPSEISVVYNTQVKMELTNPQETGVYEVLTRFGGFEDMVVFANPQAIGGRVDGVLLLRKSDFFNTAMLCHRSKVWNRSCDCPERSRYQDWFKAQTGVTELKAGRKYIACNATGNATCQFRVRKKVEDNVYSVSVDSYVSYDNRKDPEYPTTRRIPLGDGFDSYVFLNRMAGTTLRSVSGSLNIPSDFKVIETGSSGSFYDEGEGKDKSPAAPKDGKEISLGAEPDIQLRLYEKLATVHLLATGNDIYFTSKTHHTGSLNKQAALLHLVFDHGVSEDTAKEMIKEASVAGERRKSVSYFIKHADDYGNSVLRGGPGAPGFPTPNYGQEPAGRSMYPALYNDEQEIPVDDMSAYKTDPSIYDPFYTPDPNATMAAQTAVQGGQKEVFDTAMIKNLVKAVRQNDLVDKYLGDLMKAEDRLGRILLLFYWHQEEFGDRYGKKELPEMEDSLRNSFEMLGDLVLFLKEKTVQGGINVDTSMANPSPNITEISRN